MGIGVVPSTPRYTCHYFCYRAEGSAFPSFIDSHRIIERAENLRVFSKLACAPTPDWVPSVEFQDIAVAGVSLPFHRRAIMSGESIIGPAPAPCDMQKKYARTSCESLPDRHFFVGCSPPFIRFAEHLTALRAWCRRRLPAGR